MKPALSGRPVILLHLSMTGAAWGRTVCSGEEFEAPDPERYRRTPIVLCEACRRVALADQLETSPPLEEAP